MTIRRADPAEIDRVAAFYEAVIDGTAGQPYAPKWQKGIYPTRDDLARAVNSGEMYLAEADGKILGAMVMNSRGSQGYDSAPWTVAAEPEEVTVLHLLAVSPEAVRQGIGSELVRFALEQSRAAGKRAVRLDVLVGNLPADRLYRSLGFRFICRVNLFYEDTGWHEFDLFEYPL